MKLYKLLILPAVVGAGASLSSCINETPHPERCLYKVNLLVHTDTSWLPDYEITPTKAEDLQIRYQFRVYRAGTDSDPVLGVTMYSTDFTRADFYTDLTLHEGNYDIYAWSDVCDSSGEPLFYDSTDFAGITYNMPYQGDSDNKDAFRGVTSVGIDYTMYDKEIEGKIDLSRPLARYLLVATDLDDYIGSLQAKGQADTKAADPGMFDGYRVSISYPLFMPAVFNNFTDKPIDSKAGVSFSGAITSYEPGQVLIGMDYVMINGGESNAQIALEIYDDQGVKISSIPTMNIPIKRDRTTIVYGKFLTTSGEGDITINPDFKDQFNIEYN